MDDPIEILKAVLEKVVEQAYSDGVKATLQEASKIGVDALKTVRLALFPLQFTSAFQDRLAGYIDRAIRQVPPERRVAPVESLALPIAEKLRFQEETSRITEMYVNLLAPDEALLIEQMAPLNVAAYMRGLSPRPPSGAPTVMRRSRSRSCRRTNARTWRPGWCGRRSCAGRSCSIRISST